MGDVDLIPVAVGLGPVGGGPALVQVVEGLVVVAKPVLKLRAVVGAFAVGGVFVVDLPADDVGVVTEALGEFGGDDAAELAVLGVAEVKLLAAAVGVLPAVRLGAKGFGVLLREPGGRSGSGCADDDGDVVFFGEADGAVQPVELEVTLGGFHGGPGEL